MLEHSKGARRADRQAAGEADPRARRNGSRRCSTRRATRALTFEQTGIDYLIVDEAHDYKNLQTVSNIRDAAIDGSQRATDLHMKLEWLRDRHGDRVATMATATPIANSITEAHVMTRYLRPDLLQAAGVEDFDAWAATFGQTVTEIESRPDRRRGLPDAHPLRPLPERPRDAPALARVRRRQDRRGPPAARP